VVVYSMGTDSIKNITLMFNDGDSITLHGNEIAKFEMFGINLNLLWNDGQVLLAQTCYDFELVFNDDLISEAKHKKKDTQYMIRTSDKLSSSNVSELFVSFVSGYNMKVMVLGEENVISRDKTEDGSLMFRYLQQATA